MCRFDAVSVKNMPKKGIFFLLCTYMIDLEMVETPEYIAEKLA